MKSLESLAELARSAGWGAADILRAYYRGESPQGELEVEESKDGPVTSADLAANHYILKRLKDELGEDEFGYLSEETYKAQVKARGPAPFDNEWLWIVDPLDGTRDFVDRTGEYAMHIALAQNGRPVIGVVACPEADVLYCAVKGSGTVAYHRDGRTRTLKTSDREDPADLTLVVSRTHRDDRFNQLLAALPCQKQKFVGSVGGKIAAVVEQSADLYISLSGKSAPKDWDMAAPELVLTEAGGQFTHFDGRPLEYNTGDVNQWGGLMASNGRCHQMLCATADSALQAIDA